MDDPLAEYVDVQPTDVYVGQEAQTLSAEERWEFYHRDYKPEDLEEDEEDIKFVPSPEEIWERLGMNHWLRDLGLSLTVREAIMVHEVISVLHVEFYLDWGYKGKALDRQLMQVLYTKRHRQ